MSPFFMDVREGIAGATVKIYCWGLMREKLVRSGITGRWNWCLKKQR